MKNTYKAMRGKLIVAVNLSQKDDFEIELTPGINIWMNKDFGTDGKVTNPTLAIVRAVSPEVTDLKEGDLVLCHHNTFKSIVANGYRLGHMGRDGNLDLFSIDYRRVELKLDADGNAYPLKGTLIAERIEEVVDTILIVSDAHRKFSPIKFLICSVGEDCDMLKPGDKIVTYPKSDYEIDYTFGMKPRKIIRISYNDVLAILG